MRHPYREGLPPHRFMWGLILKGLPRAWIPEAGDSGARVPGTLPLARVERPSGAGP